MECDKYHRVVHSHVFSEEAHALAACLHDWIHVSPSGYVNNTFNIKSTEYLQSLAMLGLVCIVILAAKLIILGAYTFFQYYGTQTYVYRYDCIIELKRSVINMAVFCMLLSFIGILGNMTYFFTIKRFYDEFYNIYNIFGSVNDENLMMNRSLINIQMKLLDAQSDNYLLSKPDLRTVRNLAKSCRRGLTSVEAMQMHIKDMYLDSFLKKFWNWYGAACQGGIGGWLCGIMLCGLIVGAAKSRARGALLILAAVTLNALIASWCASAYLVAVGVGLSDACYAPALTIAMNLPFSPKMSEREVFYYTDCPKENIPPIVLKDELENLYRALINMRIQLDKLMLVNTTNEQSAEFEVALKDMAVNLQRAEQCHLEAHGLLSCKYTSRHFSAGMGAVCEVGLKAILVQLFASVAASFMYLMILISYISTKRPSFAVY